MSQLRVLVPLLLTLSGTLSSAEKIAPNVYMTFFPTTPIYGEQVMIGALAMGEEGGATPTGTFTFSWAGNFFTLPLDSTAHATLLLPSASQARLAVGTYSMSVAYSGDTNYQAASVPATDYVVAKAPMSIGIAAAPPQLNQLVTLKTSVWESNTSSPALGGFASFTNSGTGILGCTMLPMQNGSASCTTSFPQIGPITIGVSYSGDANTNPASTYTVLLVGKVVASVYVATAKATPSSGAPVTINALVLGANAVAAPTGFITFADNASPLATVRLGSDERASLTVPFTTGSHSITASYGGDSNYGTSASAPLNLAVGKAATSLALSASTGGPFIATLTTQPAGAGTPSGVVQFVNGGAVFAMAPLVPQAGFFTATLPASTQIGNIWAAYAGDANFGASSSLPTVVAAPSAVVVISSDHNPASPGQAVTFTVYVTPGTGTATPSGTIQLSADGVSLGTATLAAATARFTANLSPGPHVITASYSGDATYPAAIASFAQSVSKAAASLALTTSAVSTVFGQPVTLSAILSAPGGQTPGGSVQFLDGAAAIGSAALSAGTASIDVANLAAGSHSITAAWPGDSTFSASTSAALTQTVSPSPTLTRLTLGPGAVTAAVTGSTLDAGAPTGNVRFVDAVTNALLVTAPLSKGSAAVPWPSGADLLVAVYTGDANFLGSVSPGIAPLSAVNAASYAFPPLAPDEIVALFGVNLASATAIGTPQPAESLAGTSVKISGADGASISALLFFVSATQASVLIPAGAPGPASLSVTNSAGVTVSTPITLAAVAPGLFTANSSGEGAPAGQVITVHADGSEAPTQSLAMFDQQQNQWIPTPIDMGDATDTIYLILYATGVRHYKATPTCTIAGQQIAVSYAGPQGVFPGLDQVNVILPASLKGAGDVTLNLTVDGMTSNAVALSFR